MNFLRLILAFLFQTRKAVVPVTREYTVEFMDRSGAKIFLSTRQPRYCAIFSEPEAKLNRIAFDQFRRDCLADFERVAGVKISETETWNESARPLPEPRIQPRYDHDFPAHNTRTQGY